MEQAVLERRVRIIPATKPTPTSGPRHSGKQRVAAYCRVSTLSHINISDPTRRRGISNCEYW